MSDGATAATGGTVFAIVQCVGNILSSDTAFLSLVSLDPNTVDAFHYPTPAIYNMNKNRSGPVMPQCCFRVSEGSKLRPFRHYRIKRYFLDVEYWTESQQSDALDKFYEACSRLLDEQRLNINQYDGSSYCFDCHEQGSSDSGEDPVEHAYRATVRFTITAGRNPPG